MLTLLKKMFGKKPVVTVAPVRVPRVVATSPAQPKPQVAVAQLSLAAIIGKFPEDLRKNVIAAPAPEVTVALPLATIHKQLAAGAVKMSLASLYRQAPSGTFRENKSEEKRMVEVPLSEIMRHVDVKGLGRRGDQRRVELPKGAPQLFGDRNNPYTIAPSIEEEEEVVEAAAPEADEPEAPAAAPLRMAPMPVPASAPAPATLSLRLGDLCGAWPEPIRSEALSMAESQVAFPTEQLGAGVSKGKVAVSWGQLRRWITPPPPEDTEGREATELLLPLKVVAPAYLSASRPTARKRTVELDDSIPALFNGAKVEPPAEAPVEAAPDIVHEQPAPAAPLKFVLTESGPAEAPPEAAPAPAGTQAPANIGELFGKPDQKHWSPQEIIDRTAKLPGVSGAALALQEGLLVAASLPAEMKGDTVAAFLPQIFARLNTYTGEMKLAEVEDILMTTNGAHFQAYRLGQVYFAVLGKQGEALPWEALRLVVQELVSQAPA